MCASIGVDGGGFADVFGYPLAQFGRSDHFHMAAESEKYGGNVVMGKYSLDEQSDLVTTYPLEVVDDTKNMPYGEGGLRIFGWLGSSLRSTVRHHYCLRHA